MAKDIFISYSSHDQVIAFSVCQYLENNNYSCWIAPRDILPGMNYGEVLLDAIRDSKVLILIFSAFSNDSPQVMREIERAVSKGITIIPYRIENVLPSKSMEYFISSSHWLDAFNETPAKSFEMLKEALDAFGEENKAGMNKGKSNINFADRKPKNLHEILKKNKVTISFIAVILLIAIILTKYLFLSSHYDVGIYLVENKNKNESLLKNNEIILSLIKNRLKEKNIVYDKIDYRKNDLSSLAYLKDGELDNSIKADFILGIDISVSGANIFKLSWAIYERDKSDIILGGDYNLDSLSGSGIASSIVNKLSICMRLRETIRNANLNHPDSYKMFRDGELLLLNRDEGSVLKAMTYFKTLVQTEKDFVYGYLGLAKAYLIYCEDISPNDEYLTESEKNVLKAQKMNLQLGKAESYEILGRILIQKNNFEGAIKNLKLALEADPNDISAAAALGEIYEFHFNKISEAIYYFTRAKQIEPFNLTNITNLGNCFGAAGKYDNAIREFNEALALDKNNPDLLKSYGILYERQLNYDAAVKYYQEAAKLNPSDYNNFENIIAIYVLSKKFNEAVNLLQDRLKVFPKDYRLYYLLGLTYFHNKEFSKAKEYYNQGLQYAISENNKNKSSAAIKIDIARFYSQLGMEDQARYYVKEAYENAPDNSDIIIGIAGVYSILGKKDEMLKYFALARSKANDLDEFYLRTAIDYEKYRSDPDLLKIARN